MRRDLFRLIIVSGSYIRPTLFVMETTREYLEVGQGWKRIFASNLIFFFIKQI